MCFLPGEFPKISPVKKHASIRTRPDSLSRSPSFRPGYSRGLSFDPSVCLKTHAMFSLARTDQEGQPSNSPGPGKHPMQGEAPDNPTRPHFLAQGSIPCSFSSCSGAFSHDTAPGMQGRAMPFPVQSTLSWTKVARDVAGISATFFLQTGPQAVLPRMGAKHQRPLLRLPGLGSSHERQQQPARRRQREQQPPCSFAR